MQALLFIIGFLLFIGLVLIHEWGHLAAARRAGVKVKEFGLGFPPRAWSKKLKSGMLFSLNWLPLGGFIKLKGEHDLDPRPGSFGAASLKSKIKILLAGVTMNLLAGLVLLTVLAATGLPTIFDQKSAGKTQFSVSDTHIVKNHVFISGVLQGSPAQVAGLQNRDIIESISAGGQTVKVDSTEKLYETTARFAGKQTTVVYKHGSQLKQTTVNLLDQKTVQDSRITDSPKGHLGVQTTDIAVTRSGWSSPVVAAGLTLQLGELTVKGIWHSLSGLGSAIAGLVSGNHTARVNGQTKASDQTGGPVAVGAILWDSGALGLSFVLMIIAVVSLTLALVNALPIPALDGGRLLLILLFRLLKRPLKPEIEDRVHAIGMIVLLILIVLITTVDVKRYF